jgi:hypothetical protein
MRWRFEEQNKPRHKFMNMKFKAISTGLAACALAALLSGCGKDETKPAETPKSAPVITNPAPSAASAPAAEVVPTPAEVKPAVETPVTTTTQPVVEPAPAAATPPADTAVADAQTLIDKAKGLVDGKMYQEALDVISQLGALKLSPEQQKQVDDLKAQVQNLMSGQTVSNAVNSVGNLLGK